MLPETVIDMKDVDRANKQLHQIYTLYNGHMQISLTARDEILQSKFYKHMIRDLGHMRQQVQQKDHEIDQLNNLLDEYVTQERLQKQKFEAERAAERAANNQPIETNIHNPSVSYGYDHKGDVPVTPKDFVQTSGSKYFKRQQSNSNINQ